jgi:ABC-type polysaccharide/polyol phosphate transport system ATPase subunit
MASIQLDDVSLTFHVRRHRGAPLKELMLQKLTGRAAENPILEVQALRNLDLRLRDGDRVGIIGHNGAGKSTLLKMLGGVYPPSSGRRIVQGHVNGLFDMTLGFQMHATGRENIMFRGYLLGETPKTIKPKVDGIIEFSELGDFIDTPMRYYSSGMMVRLGFAITTAIDPEILLIDECFGAGDASFQQKARKRMRELMDRASLLVMVGHDIGLLRDLSTRVLWMEHGRVRRDGSPAEITREYLDFMRDHVSGVGGAIAQAA